MNINDQYEMAMLEDVKIYLEENFNERDLLHAEDIQNISEDLGAVEQGERIINTVNWKDEGVQVKEIIEDIKYLIEWV